MKARHIKFIREELIPFILREQGRGFAMDRWYEEYPPAEDYFCDGIKRSVPACGTVACISGSIAVLKRDFGRHFGRYLTDYGKHIGLEHRQASILFVGWLDQWPQPFRSKYAKAKTPLAKAKVACALLEEVCRTKGECLEV